MNGALLKTKSLLLHISLSNNFEGVLYKVFLNESFDECLTCINSFVNSYFVTNSKLV